MKRVFNSAQVGHVWAAQSQADGRNGQGNFYFSGPAIYSYRQGYAIATFSPWKDESGNRIIIARQSPYGPTTGRHMRQAQNATRGHAITWLECDPYILSPSFRDYGSREATLIADGDTDTGRCIVRALVAHAADAADAALSRRADGGIAWAYRKAADYLSSAQTLSVAILATLKGKERNKEARNLARIMESAPALPDGFLARAIADSKRGRYPGWQAPRALRDEWEASQRAIYSMPCADHVQFQRAASLAKREAKKARDLANAIADANKFDKEARQHKTLYAATRARHAWLALVVLARRLKVPAATRAPWIAAEARAFAREEARKPAETIKDGQGIIAWYLTALPNLIRAAAIARKSGDCRRVTWVGNPAASKRATKATYNRGFESLQAIGDSVLRVSQTIKGAQNPHKETFAKIQALRALAGKRGKYQAQARAILATLETLADGGMETGKRASARAAGRRLSMIVHRVAGEARMIPKLSIATARQVERESAQLLRAWPEAPAALLRAYGLPERAAIESLNSKSKAYGQAASVGAELHDLERATNMIAGHLDASQEKAGAGLVFDALKSADRAQVAIDSARRDSARIAGNIARAQETDCWGTAIASAYQEASALAANVAARIAELRPIVAACLERAQEAAQAASADALGHWRATGEAARGLWDSLPGSAYFRLDSRGMIVSNMGASVSQDAGARLWALIRAAVSSARGKTWDYGKGPRVGSFHLESVNADGSAKVGCHWIMAGEAREFARIMAWPPFDK